MRDNYDDQSMEERQHSRTLDREEREWEKIKASVEAMQRGTTKYIKEALENEVTRQNLAREGFKATESYNQGSDAGLRTRLGSIDNYGGVFKGYDDQEVITGLEQRPWERE